MPDLWIVPKNQTMFDGFTSMDDLPYDRAKKVVGVQDVARIVWGDAAWRLPSSGGKEYIQVLGVDLESSIAARFHYSGFVAAEATVDGNSPIPFNSLATAGAGCGRGAGPCLSRSLSGLMGAACSSEPGP